MNSPWMVSLRMMLALAAFCSVLPAQDHLWLRSEQGAAMVLDPISGVWAPVGERTESMRRTFLLTKERSAVKVFDATEVYPVGAEWYVFLDDLVPKTRSRLVSELTRIEAEQLPRGNGTGDSARIPDVGLTYGRRKGSVAAEGTVPYRQQRINTVNAAMAVERYDLAVLTMKRMLARYPSQYFDRTMVERLFGLYERLGLDGFLFDESSRLMALVRNQDDLPMLQRWNAAAKDRLRNR